MNILHFHGVGAPELVKVLPVFSVLERFEKGALAIVKYDALRSIFILISRPGAINLTPSS